MKVRDAILKLGSYTPPLKGRNPNNYLLLDFNESPVPPPSHVIDALVEFIEDNRLQAYPSYGDFLEQLAAYAQVSSNQLILTNGSDQAIDIILRALLNEGDEMILAKPGFAIFFQFAGTLGARVISPEFRSDMGFPSEEIVNAVTPQTRLIVVINPNNPTGTLVNVEYIQHLLESFPEIAVLVDEAYFEFTLQTCSRLLEDHENLIITRTFSKAFALPSLRLGYAIAHKSFIEHLYKIRGPYDVNMIALVAARAQLIHPQPWQQIIREIMREAKPSLERFFEEQGITCFKGAANFMLVAPDNVAAAIDYLKAHKILVRPMHPPIAHTFRMSIGTLLQTRQFIEIFTDFLNNNHTY